MYKLKFTSRALNYPIKFPNQCCCCGCLEPKTNYLVSMKWQYHKHSNVVENKGYLKFPICQRCLEWTEFEHRRKIFLLFSYLAIPTTIILFISAIFLFLSRDYQSAKWSMFFACIFTLKLLLFKKMLIGKPVNKPSDTCNAEPVMYLGHSNHIHTFQFSNRDFHEQVKLLNSKKKQI